MKDLIYNQRHIPRDQWRYGFRSSAATGCGWIAIHNALRILGYSIDTQALIRACERQLPLIHGNAGTAFWGPAVLMRRWGFPVEVCTDRKEFDDFARRNDVCILYYFWHQKWKMGAHFVCLHHKDGEFIGYNTFRNSTGPDHYGKSLSGFLEQKKYVAPILIGIRDKR
ncbi:MAG: hypothetical protein IKU68_01780 [Oscillospiraceae bacterium]|nr:hypothetical protein [Oscillospiraceae bacterium]